MKRGQEEAEKQNKKQMDDKLAQQRGTKAIQKIKAKQSLVVYEKEMKLVQKKDAYEKIK